MTDLVNRVLMDNFSPGQHERYEAYRRSALNKQSVRKVSLVVVVKAQRYSQGPQLVHQTLGVSVSPTVAQVVAGFAKVFVGEVIEKARTVQSARGDTGPLSPDHLREAYRLYQEETGRVGAAKPLRGKKLSVR